MTTDLLSRTTQRIEFAKATRNFDLCGYLQDMHVALTEMQALELEYRKLADQYGDAMQTLAEADQLEWVLHVEPK